MCGFDVDRFEVVLGALMLLTSLTLLVEMFVRMFK